jgi:hypothetical protein
MIILFPSPFRERARERARERVVASGMPNANIHHRRPHVLDHVNHRARIGIEQLRVRGRHRIASAPATDNSLSPCGR